MTVAAQNLEQADKRVKEAFVEGYNSYRTVYDKIFIVEPPQRLNERFTIVKTDSDVLEVADGAPFPSGQITEIGANVISQKVFKASIIMSDLAEHFDPYGAMSQVATQKGTHFNFKLDSLAAALLNNATSTSAPYGFNVAGTTTAMVSTSQPIGDSGLTQSNRLSGAHDRTNANLARSTLIKMKTHDKTPIGYQLTRIVVPTIEEMNTWQMWVSTGDSETANNGMNGLRGLQGSVEIIQWQLLTDGNYAFYLAARNNAGAKGLRYEIKLYPEMRRIINQQTGTPEYQVRMICNPGIVDYQGIVSVGV